MTQDSPASESGRSRAAGKAPWNVGLEPGRPQAPALSVEMETQKPRRSNADSPITAQMTAVVSGNTDFAFNFYRKVVKPDENLVFSPLSVSTGFALLQPGARGETARELNETLRFAVPDADLHPAFAAILARLNDPGEGLTGFFSDKHHRNTLNFANRIWVDVKAKPFAPEYLKVVRDVYGLEPTRIDFHDLEKVRRTINTWVSNQTSQQIPELIPPNTLIPDPSPIVPTNAVWLDARWKNPFPQAGYFSSGKFHAFDGDCRATYMECTGWDSYAEVNDLQLLQKNYVGERLSMLALLPKGRDRAAFERLEASLSAKRFQDLRRLIKPQRVEVTLPKFDFHTKLTLKETLEKMGLRQIWNQNLADLSGMDLMTSRHLYFSGHESRIKVDEEGTKASAGWAGGGGYGGGSQKPPPPPPKFIADHPFLFLIQDNHTGSILFLGRVMKP